MLKVSIHTVHDYVRAIYREHDVNARPELLSRYIWRNERGEAVLYDAASEESKAKASAKGDASTPSRVERLEVGTLVADNVSGLMNQPGRIAAMGGSAAAAIVIGVFMLTGSTRSPDVGAATETPLIAAEMEPNSAVTTDEIPVQYGATVTTSVWPGQWTPVDRLVPGRRYRTVATGPLRARQGILITTIDAGAHDLTAHGGVLEVQPQEDETCYFKIVDLGPSGLEPREVENLDEIDWASLADMRARASAHDF